VDARLSSMYVDKKIDIECIYEGEMSRLLLRKQPALEIKRRS
jgi:hypothetical protein